MEDLIVRKVPKLEHYHMVKKVSKLWVRKVSKHVRRPTHNNFCLISIKPIDEHSTSSEVEERSTKDAVIT